MFRINRRGFYATLNQWELLFGGKKSAPHPPHPAPVVEPEPEPEPEPDPEGGDTKAVERTKVRAEQVALSSLLDEDEDQATTII